MSGSHRWVVTALAIVVLWLVASIIPMLCISLLRNDRHDGLSRVGRVLAEMYVGITTGGIVGLIALLAVR